MNCQATVNSKMLGSSYGLGSNPGDDAMLVEFVVVLVLAPGGFSP